MSDYFSSLEAELRAAVPRVVRGPAGDRPWAQRALVPALTVGVALAVAAAVLLLGHTRRPAPATPPPAPAQQQARRAAPYPTLAQLLANFGVLRRSQTPADRSWVHAGQAVGDVVGRYTRLATRVGGDTRVFLTVGHEHGFSGQPVRRLLLAISIVDRDGNSSGTDFGPNVNYNVFPLPDGGPRRSTSQAPVVWAGIVPDGVRRVAWTFVCSPYLAHPRLGCAASRRLTATVTVRGNVAAASLPGDTGDCPTCLMPTSITWYGSGGRALGTFTQRTFNLVIPPFVIDGRLVIRSSRGRVTLSPRRLLSGDGIGPLRFGASRARAQQLLTVLAHVHAVPHATLAECGVDATIGWRAPDGVLLSAYFDHGRFVGYQYGIEGAKRPTQLRGAGLRLATDRGLTPGDTLAQGRRIYGSRFVISAAQDGSWEASTPAGRIDGFTLVRSGEPMLSVSNLVATVDAGNVGCPALSP